MEISKSSFISIETYTLSIYNVYNNNYFNSNDNPKFAVITEYGILHYINYNDNSLKSIILKEISDYKPISINFINILNNITLLIVLCYHVNYNSKDIKFKIFFYSFSINNISLHQEFVLDYRPVSTALLIRDQRYYLLASGYSSSVHIYEFDENAYIHRNFTNRSILSNDFETSFGYKSSKSIPTCILSNPLIVASGFSNGLLHYHSIITNKRDSYLYEGLISSILYYYINENKQYLIIGTGSGILSIIDLIGIAEPALIQFDDSNVISFSSGIQCISYTYSDININNNYIIIGCYDGTAAIISPYYVDGDNNPKFKTIWSNKLSEEIYGATITNDKLYVVTIKGFEIFDILQSS